MDTLSPSRPWSILPGSTSSRNIGRPTRATRGGTQDTTQGLQRLPRRRRSRQRAYTLRRRRRRARPTQKALHRVRRHVGTPNDRPPPTKNGNQDDDRTEARIQNNGIQQPVGPDHEHNSVLRATRPVSGATRRSRNHNK